MFNGSTNSTANMANANPKNAPRCAIRAAPISHVKKAGESEQAGRHRNLDEDVVAIGQRTSRLDMLRVCAGWQSSQALFSAGRARLPRTGDAGHSVPPEPTLGCGSRRWSRPSPT